MPDFPRKLSDQVDQAVALAKAAELIKIRSLDISQLRRALSLKRLQLIYEMAFLRLFAQWEVFLEETFLRYLCGYTHSQGQETPTSGRFEPTLTDARNVVLGGQRYVLWHSPNRVIDRSTQFFQNGHHELVISSNFSRLEWFAAVRHRIAHDQEDARFKFDQASMNLCGKRFLGGRPGAFLRDGTLFQGQTIRWLEAIAKELCGLATQIVP